MTEERMICEQHSFKKPYYAPEVTTTNTHEEIYIEVKTTWIPVEPAPSKDWRPACFQVPVILQEIGCPGYDNGTSKSCGQCPYRKME